MSNVTQILSQIEQGDPQAAEKLLPLVDDELRKLAGPTKADFGFGVGIMRLLARTTTIDRIRAKFKAERSTEGHTKKKEADSRRREKVQAEYVEDFQGKVVAWLFYLPQARANLRLLPKLILP